MWELFLALNKELGLQRKQQIKAKVILKQQPTVTLVIGQLKTQQQINVSFHCCCLKA